LYPASQFFGRYLLIFYDDLVVTVLFLPPETVQKASQNTR